MLTENDEQWLVKPNPEVEDGRPRQYDPSFTGRLCQVCGAPTTSGCYGAPGVGRFETCANGHGLEYGMGDEPHILTIWEVM